MAKWGKIGAPRSAKRRAWLSRIRRGRKRSSPKRRSSSPRRTSRRTSKVSRRVRARKMLGTVGFKGLAIGIGLTFAVRYLIRRFLPQAVGYGDSLSLIGAGLAGAGVKQLGTKHLLTPGIILGASKLLEDVVTPNGLWTFPGIGAPTVRYDL